MSSKSESVTKTATGGDNAKFSVGSNLILAVSVSLFLISFCAPVSSNSSRTFYGFHAFAMSLMLLLQGEMIVWLANPAYIIAFYARERHPQFALCSGVAGLTLTYSLPVDSLQGLTYGMTMWIVSQALLTLVCTAEFINRVRVRKQVSAWQYTTGGLLATTVGVALACVIFIIPALSRYRQNLAIARLNSIRASVGIDRLHAHPLSLLYLLQRVHGKDVYQEVSSVSLGNNTRELDDSHLTSLLSFRKLKRLSLHNMKLTKDGAQTVAALKSLVQLNLYDSRVDDEFIEALQQLPTLSELNLILDSVSLRKMRTLIALADVKVDLHIKSYVTSEVLQMLTQVSGLYLLSLAQVEASPEAWSKFSEFTGLHSLSLGRVKVSPEAWSRFGKIAGLRALDIGEAELSSSGFQALSRQTSVVVLRIGDVKAVDMAWDALLTMPNLREIHTKRSSFPLATFRAISRQRLTYLNLNDAIIPDGGVSMIATQRGLKSLALNRARFNVMEIKSLVGMSNISRLELRGTQVSDDHVDVLSSLAGLRNLNISATLISPEAVATLRSKLPLCKIEY